MNKRRLVIKNGCMSGFKDEFPEINGASIDVVTTQRVSRIMPVNWFLRVMFILTRMCCSDTSSLAQFTRGWTCRWVVIIDGKQHGIFACRLAAIEHEKQVIYRQGKLKAILERPGN